MAHRDTKGRLARPDWSTLVGLGGIPNFRRVAIYGNNPSIDTTSAPEDIWGGGGQYNWLASPAIIEVLSSNAADAVSGTGARSIEISGLDSNYNEISETIALDGVTPVTSTQQFFRVNRAVITSAGSGKTNAGNITVRAFGGGAVLAVLSSGYGTSRKCAFTIPAGFTFTLNMISAFVNNTESGVTKSGILTSYLSPQGRYYLRPAEFSVSSNAPFYYGNLKQIIIQEKTDFNITCMSVSHNSTNISVLMTGILSANGAM